MLYSQTMRVCLWDISCFVGCSLTFVNLCHYYSLCKTVQCCSNHDDVIKWKQFPCYWPFVRGIHQSLVDSPHKGQWHRALMFSWICTWTNTWANNEDTNDLRRHHTHYDITVMEVNFLDNPHNRHPTSSPLMLKYGVSFVSTDRVTAGLCRISCYIEPRYNGTWLNHFLWNWFNENGLCWVYLRKNNQYSCISYHILSRRRSL